MVTLVVFIVNGRLVASHYLRPVAYYRQICVIIYLCLRRILLHRLVPYDIEYTSEKMLFED